MTNIFKNPGIIFSALYILALVACKHERQPCFTPKTAILNMRTVHFRAPGDSGIVDTALPAAVFGAMTTDSLKGSIYPRQSNFILSLSTVADSCRWMFTTDSFKQDLDTLTFYYSRKLQFISNACGYTYFFDLD